MLMLNFKLVLNIKFLYTVPFSHGYMYPQVEREMGY